LSQPSCSAQPVKTQTINNKYVDILFIVFNYELH